MSDFKPYSNTEPAPAGWYQRAKLFGSTPDAKSSLLPYQAEFQDVLDTAEERTGRAVSYKSIIWYVAYDAYIAGRTDQLIELNRTTGRVR